MATKLPKFDFDAPSNLTTSEKATYPWADWFDGDIWQITWAEDGSEDFTPHPLMMERIIRTRATGRKAKVRLRHVAKNGDSPFGIIVFQRKGLEGPMAAKKAAAAAKRQAKRAAAQKDAEATLARAGIKAAPAKSAASKRAAYKVSKTPAKRPVPA